MGPTKEQLDCASSEERALKRSSRLLIVVVVVVVESSSSSSLFRLGMWLMALENNGIRCLSLSVSPSHTHTHTHTEGRKEGKNQNFLQDGWTNGTDPSVGIGWLDRQTNVVAVTFLPHPSARNVCWFPRQSRFPSQSHTDRQQSLTHDTDRMTGDCHRACPPKEKRGLVKKKRHDQNKNQ